MGLSVCLPASEPNLAGARTLSSQAVAMEAYPEVLGALRVCRAQRLGRGCGG
jgi:hypothetical protein